MSSERAATGTATKAAAIAGALLGAAATCVLCESQDNISSSNEANLNATISRHFTANACNIGVIFKPIFHEIFVTFRRFWHNGPRLPRIQPVCAGARYRVFPSAIEAEQVTPADDLMRENQALRERLSRLSEASLRINESLDPDTRCCKEVLDSACLLTGARYGVHRHPGRPRGRLLRTFMGSGLTPEESPASCWEMPEGLSFFAYLSSDSGAAATSRDFHGGAHEGRWAFRRATRR